MLARKMRNRLACLQLSLASARTLLATGQAAVSRLRLNQILTEAGQHGFVGFKLEARLVIAEWESKSGKDASRWRIRGPWSRAPEPNASASSPTRLRPVESGTPGAEAMTLARPEWQTKSRREPRDAAPFSIRNPQWQTLAQNKTPQTPVRVVGRS